SSRERERAPGSAPGAETTTDASTARGNKVIVTGDVVTRIRVVANPGADTVKSTGSSTDSSVNSPVGPAVITREGSATITIVAPAMRDPSGATTVPVSSSARAATSISRVFSRTPA